MFFSYHCQERTGCQKKKEKGESSPKNIDKLFRLSVFFRAVTVWARGRGFPLVTLSLNPGYIERKQESKIGYKNLTF